MSDLQDYAYKVGVATFGARSMDSQTERADRAAEEFFELMQACGRSWERLMEIGQHVYGRPAGDLYQEFGGARITLDMLAKAHGCDTDLLGWREARRVDENKQTIRKKAALKPDHIFSVRPIKEKAL